MYSAIGQSQNCQYLYTDFNTNCCEKIIDFADAGLTIPSL